eukprot:CAMPEP_0175156706 /NCGR_PEP_ID=MMETSP0087-20121206/21765_1 /TAXON_ID=136419 /ORGANISM="Unknown Unknown, Strain D1" /LENGTH=787 /DNA_ID=CAMNT_0016444173 /DNA_START=31 /DNA_END=2394 /DNA_ORIENTATION=+
MGCCSSSSATPAIGEEEQPTVKTADIDFQIVVTEPGKECDPEIARWLTKVPVLTSLNAKEKEILGSHLVEKKYSNGEFIIIQGATGEEFYLIKSGNCNVIVDDKVLAKLQPSDYFGEKALLNDTPRAASVRADGPCVVLSLDRKKFVNLFGQSKLKVKFGKRVGVSAETHDPNAPRTSSVPSDAVRTKTAAQRAVILEVVKRNILFKSLDLSQCNTIVDEMWRKVVSEGTSIIKQGDLGDNFYVVESGEFDIFVKKDGVSKRVATFGEGTSFGELALMYNAARAATVTATQKSVLWAVDRWTFRQVLTKVSRQKIKEYEAFLQGVQAFSSLLAHERSQVAEALEEVSFPGGHKIIKEGDEGDTFFILRKGVVVVDKLQPDGSTRQVKEYRPGDYFGERALVKNDVRAATCTTVGPVECLCLDRRAFNLLLGPLEEIFQDGVSQYKHTPIDTRGSINRASTDALPTLMNTNIKMSDLSIIGTLGKGSFGHVQLVKDSKDPSKTYALKTVSKVQIVKSSQQTHIMNEKRVMAALDHPFVVKLHATFKDRDYLYFLLEPSLGGELFSVLRAYTFFKESVAQFYAAGVVLAFEYMHSKSIIYRDLKPENLLLDDRGYLKITDFGFAKELKEGRTYTLCGTPDYLAPEVVGGQGHGKGVDWWTLGILIYEMLASEPPFYDDDQLKTYNKIMHGQLSFPMHFTKNSVDLIKRLLHPKATKRLGVCKGGKKIREHPWFKDFPWQQFYAKQIKAPIIKPVANAHDLSNFEEYPEEDQQAQRYEPDPKNPNWDADF